MIKTRIAPSPTGKLHIGNARAALFSYLFAKQRGGLFLLRIEDTDRARSRKEFEDDIYESFTWLNLSWDESYKQSERLSEHKTCLEQLLKEGKIFYCPHSQGETEGAVHFCSKRDEPTKSAPGSIIRFKTPLDREVVFEDMVRGKVRFSTNEIGDFSIAKSLDEPLYNFAVVVDDAQSNVSHVIRGEDHISNTPKQILLQQALGLSTPLYAHLPIMVGPDHKKLSKRAGSVSVSEFRAQGYLAQAVINMMAFMGWNPGDNREFFTLPDLLKEFSMERVKKGGAVFDIKRLNFLNQHYLRSLPVEEITDKAKEFFIRGYGQDALKNINSLVAIVDLERTRVVTLLDLVRSLDFVFSLPAYEASLLRWKDQSFQEVKENLAVSLSCLESLSEGEYTQESLRNMLINEARKQGDKGKFLWPLRVALSGKKHSPGPIEIAAALGKQESIKRIRHAIELSKNA